MATFVGDVFAVKAVCRCLTTPLVVFTLNIRHYRAVVVTGVSTTDQQVASAMDAFWAPIYRAILPIATDYRGIILQKVFPAPPALSVIANANAGIGLRAAVGTLLPTQVCGMITKLTPAAGRAFRGRVYVPFPAENDNEVSTPNAAYLTLIQGMANGETVPITAGVGLDTSEQRQVIFRRTLPALSVQMTGATVRSYWTTQRRRNSGIRADPTII